MRKKFTILAGVAAIALVGFVSNANATGRGNDDRPTATATGTGTGIGIGTGTGIASATANPTAIGIGGHQQQGQVQGQQTEVTTNQQQQTRVRTTATGGRASATGGTARAATGPVAATGGQGGAVTYNEAEAMRYSGRYTVRNTPDAYAPATYPTAPCIVAPALGVALPGFGVSGSIPIRDERCDTRATAAMAHRIGDEATAQEVMCGVTEFREARARLGRPCATDRPAAPAMASVAAPLSGAVVQPVMTTPLPAATPVATSVPDFCYTLADARERRRYATACGFAGS